MHYRLIILLSLCFRTATAQNLVLNPGFEETSDCAYTLGQFAQLCKHWSTPNQGSTDLLNACAEDREVGVPRNVFGQLDAYSGKNYAGFYAISQGDYREYVQGQLTTPLKAGERYRLTFYIALGLVSDYAVKELGVAFTNGKVWTANQFILTPNTLERNGHPNVAYTALEGRPYHDRHDWTKITATFVARGGETHFCIGNFKSVAKTDKREVARVSRGLSYYYIDQVSVEALWIEKETVSAADRPDETPLPSFTDGETYVLQHVLFEFDSILLDADAQAELRSLGDYLSAHPSKDIRIEGHTDTIGSEAYNLDISHKRAAAVAEFLIETGVSPDRIATTGLGFAEPIATNDTEEGRAQNRRVVFVITERD